jgi:hypothetical protein
MPPACIQITRQPSGSSKVSPSSTQYGFSGATDSCFPISSPDQFDASREVDVLWVRWSAGRPGPPGRSRAYSLLAISSISSAFTLGAYSGGAGSRSGTSPPSGGPSSTSRSLPSMAEMPFQISPICL